jgi:hypothetical protein
MPTVPTLVSTAFSVPNQMPSGRDVLEGGEQPLPSGDTPSVLLGTVIGTAGAAGGGFVVLVVGPDVLVDVDDAVVDVDVAAVVLVDAVCDFFEHPAMVVTERTATERRIDARNTRIRSPYRAARLRPGPRRRGAVPRWGGGRKGRR